MLRRGGGAQDFLIKYYHGIFRQLRDASPIQYPPGVGPMGCKSPTNLLDEDSPADNSPRVGSGPGSSGVVCKQEELNSVAERPNSSSILFAQSRVLVTRAFLLLFLFSLSAAMPPETDASVASIASGALAACMPRTNCSDIF